MRDDSVEAELAALRARIDALEAQTAETAEVIRAQRVDIVEPDGRVRLSLANGPLSPDAIVDGVVLAAGRERPGIIFFNDVGDECSAARRPRPDATAPHRRRRRQRRHRIRDCRRGGRSAHRSVTGA